MKTREDLFLESVKRILVRIEAIKPNVILCRKSWLTYFYSGYDPGAAIKEDLGIKSFNFN